LILLLVTTLISIFGIVYYSAEKVNKEARITTENYVTAIIDDRSNQLQTLAKDYAYWDDTITHAYRSQNSEWIKENIGEYLTDTFKITDLAIINSQNEPVLSLKYGQVDNSTYATINKDALISLIEKARQSGTVPVPVSGILMIDGTPAIVGVAVLAPEDGTSLPSPRPLLLLAKRLNQSYFQELSKQYRLSDLLFTPSGQSGVADSSIKIINPLNKTLGRLSWRPEKPGDLVLAKLQLPILLLLVVISLITLFIISVSRKTERRLQNAYEELAFNANHDALTGLANRRLFNEIMLQTIRSAKRDNISCALLYIDLDDFKDVNDEYGHEAGDQVLVKIAKRIKSSVRESDTIARIGGDEFIVLLHKTIDRDDIKATAEKILKKLTQPIEVKENEVKVSASIGITISPDDGIDLDALMSKADSALYSCKKQGRNAYQFYTDFQKTA